MKKSLANLEASAGLSSLLNPAPSSSDIPTTSSPVKFTLYLDPQLAERVELLASLKGMSKSRFLASVLSSSLYSDSYSVLVEKMRQARL